MSLRSRVPPWIARLSALLLALGAVQSPPARAEEAPPRYVPRAGAMLTYRTMSHTQMNAATTAPIDGGFVYTVVITSSDDLVARGFIRESEMLFPANTCTGRCEVFRRAEGAHLAGDVWAIPIPDPIADAYAGFSEVRYRLFMSEMRRFPAPGLAAEPQSGTDSVALGKVPEWILTMTLDCDKAALQSFLPFGKAPRVQLECSETRHTLHLLPALQWPVPTPVQTRLAVELAYEGMSRTTTPAGEWAVQNVHITQSAPDNSGAGREERDILFSDKIGAVIRWHSVVYLPGDTGTTITDADLIRYEERR
jgi:hypothetical protein